MASLANLRRLSPFLLFAALLSVTGCTHLKHALGLPAEPEPQPITFETLLGEMTDLDRLADLPDPAYLTRQASSWDRGSTSPLSLDGWFANKDAGFFLREETGPDGETEHVLMDEAGPGAIVRIWSAMPEPNITLRFYLDGATTPTFELTHAQLMQGEWEPFISPISHLASRGGNSYLPIPYARHCKVTSKQKGFYYHINYRTYEPGASVETFDMAQAQRMMPHVRQVAGRLADRANQSIPYQNPALRTRAKSVSGEIAPGASAELEIKGRNRAIYRMELKATAGNVGEALRGTLLEITFDDMVRPAVSVPLGDFFGMATGIHPFETLAVAAREDGTLIANWVMPFRRIAVIRLTNTTDEPVRVEGAIEYGRRRWTDRTMYFHADWRHEQGIPTRPFRDWNYINLTGQGRYVGNLLHVMNPAPIWWGEGDEKIYLDGEAFPSTFGTGTEDYYGYAWGNTEPFSFAYHAQPTAGRDCYGHTLNNRLHILDDYPFNSSLRFDMEIWNWAETQVDMAVTNWWYGLPGASDNLLRPEPAEMIYTVPEPYYIAEGEGVIEGERMRIIEVDGGEAKGLPGAEWKCSRSAYLGWTGAKPGGQLDLGLRTREPGRYRISGVFLKAPDYGGFRFLVNGEVVKPALELRHTRTIRTTEIPLGEAELRRRGNTFTIHCLGHSGAWEGKNNFGLDYIRIEKID